MRHVAARLKRSHTLRSRAASCSAPHQYSATLRASVPLCPRKPFSCLRNGTAMVEALSTTSVKGKRPSHPSNIKHCIHGQKKRTALEFDSLRICLASILAYMYLYGLCFVPLPSRRPWCFQVSCRPLTKKKKIRVPRPQTVHKRHCTENATHYTPCLRSVSSSLLSLQSLRPCNAAL